jgi:DNA-binding response OmpR family regulator
MESSGAYVERILVVEDEPAIADVCRKVLIGEGLEVDIAVNEMVAQDMIQGQQYDLCLVDIMTPRMNGRELYQWLEDKHPQLANRVIFTTGDVMGGDTQRFLQQVGRPCLPKPFALDELRAIVRETLRQFERQAEE